jgi:hypothetical protein
MLQLYGYSIPYRIATSKQQGRKNFSLQTIAPMAEQWLSAGFSLHSGVISNTQERGLNSKGCDVILSALGYQKKFYNNDLRQG